MASTTPSPTLVKLLQDEVMAAVAHTEALMNSKFGSVENPLLVSVRSGARASMPGMMDTILNLGLNDEVAEGLVKKTHILPLRMLSHRTMKPIGCCYEQGITDGNLS